MDGGTWTQYSTQVNGQIAGFPTEIRSKSWILNFWEAVRPESLLYRCVGVIVSLRNYKQVASYALYDAGNSNYTTLVPSIAFPIYFKTVRNTSAVCN
jgi:hypothetical protein